MNKTFKILTLLILVGLISVNGCSNGKVPEEAAEKSVDYTICRVEQDRRPLDKIIWDVEEERCCYDDNGNGRCAKDETIVTEEDTTKAETEDMSVIPSTPPKEEVPEGKEEVPEPEEAVDTPVVEEGKEEENITEVVPLDEPQEINLTEPFQEEEIPEPLSNISETNTSSENNVTK